MRFFQYDYTGRSGRKHFNPRKDQNEIERIAYGKTFIKAIQKDFPYGKIKFTDKSDDI